MSASDLTPSRFAELLPRACDRNTSADPDGWTAQNPLRGHCAVVALAAQSLFGGQLLRASLENVPEFAAMGSHYWNRLGDGSEVDFTRSQFGEHPPAGLVAEERTRAYVLSHPPARSRYNLLTMRLALLAADGDASKAEELRQRFSA